MDANSALKIQASVCPFLQVRAQQRRQGPTT